MAFNTNAQPAVNAGPRGNAAQGNDNWKASGFLNFYLPSKNGARRKLGAIPLKDSVANEKQLLEWLREDPEARAAMILASIQIEYRSAEADPATGFDLDGLGAPAKAAVPAKAKKTA